MHLMKRIMTLVCFLGLFLGFACTAPASAANRGTVFVSAGEREYITLNDSEDFDYGRKEIEFAKTPDGVLLMRDDDTKRTLMTFRSYEGSRYADFSVRTIRTANPSMTFFEIVASDGAHAKNTGYWIVGKQDGQWVVFVSIDSLAAMGYTPEKWHRIKTAVNEYGNGKFILTSEHEYMPPGAEYGYQMKTAVDLRLELFWDRNARWFGIRPY